MVNRVVSTKLSEEEHSKILEFCNDTGITVSSMVKQAIIERIRNEEKKTNQYNSPKNSSEQLANENQNSKKQQTQEGKNEDFSDERYAYF